MDDPGFVVVRCLFSVLHLMFLFIRHHFHTAMLGCVFVCLCVCVISKSFHAAIFVLFPIPSLHS